MNRFVGQAALVLVAVILLASCSGGKQEDTAADVHLVSINAEGFADVREFLEAATYVVIGQPVGEPETTILGREGTLADYTHRILVSAVIKGDPTGELLVIRTGVNKDSDAQILLEGGNEEEAGRIPPGKYVFFLMPSAKTGVWSILGNSQGLVRLTNGVIQDAPFPELDGMDESQIQAYVQRGGR